MDLMSRNVKKSFFTRAHQLSARKRRKGVEYQRLHYVSRSVIDDYTLEMKVIRANLIDRQISAIDDKVAELRKDVSIYMMCMDDPKFRKEIYEICTKN